MEMLHMTDTTVRPQATVVRMAHRRRSLFEYLVPTRDVTARSVIVLTHLLPDSREYLAAIQRVASVACVIAVPYSCDHAMLRELRDDGVTVLTPTLDDLLSPVKLGQLVSPYVPATGDLAITEIGGYFAGVVPELARQLGHRFRGVIEDTAAGHRRYQSATPVLPCPVVSVARSSLKEAEDVLVGESCLHSTEAMLRAIGEFVRGRHVLVLGYGRVGQGLARSLAGRRCHVMVYDVDPVRRAVALNEGFAIPTRSAALRSAEIVFGATGQQSLDVSDLDLLRDGVVLASCSSKQVEFAEGLRAAASRSRAVTPRVTEHVMRSRQWLMLNDGRPVNFSDQVSIGPALSLVQAEIVCAIDGVLSGGFGPGIHEMDETLRQKIAEAWIDMNCSAEDGRLLWT
ncbi:NAD(P)-dependent oxidoreductase [Amycolatopsis sp. NPDC049868]|uniref:NAD(P)-dependent oxidoreductase n=1 Tax=Amycolatopsis sp. NPDC049868 TaxID=3363934 RepID=UPI0037B64B87